MVIERVTMAANARLVDHQHSRPHMLVVLSGEIVEDGVRYVAGDVRVSQPSDRHFLVFDRTAECLIVHGDVPSIGQGVRRVVSLPEVVRALQRTAGEDGVHAIVNSDLVRDAFGEDAPAWLTEVDAELRRGRFPHARCVGTIARAAGVSREHLSRSYRRYFGSSITEAIKARRLHAAWDAVTASTTALADVAGEHGFADQSHMTRHFIGWIGLSPGQARRIVRKVTRLQDGSLALGVS